LHLAPFICLPLNWEQNALAEEIKLKICAIVFGSHMRSFKISVLHLDTHDRQRV